MTGSAAHAHVCAPPPSPTPTRASRAVAGQCTATRVGTGGICLPSSLCSPGRVSFFRWDTRSPSWPWVLDIGHEFSECAQVLSLLECPLPAPPPHPPSLPRSGNPEFHSTGDTRPHSSLCLWVLISAGKLGSFLATHPCAPSWKGTTHVANLTGLESASAQHISCI